MATEREMEREMYRFKELAQREGLLYLITFLIVAVAVVLYVV